MNSSVAQICIIIISIFVLICIVKNNKKIAEEIEELKKQKNLGIITVILIIGIILIGGFYLKNQFHNLRNNINYLNKVKADNVFFDNCDELIAKEKEYYNLCINKNYQKKYNEPYIIPGFKHIEGEWDSGFVIEDENGNQFVWVPVSNVEEEDVVKLQKKDFIIDANIQMEYCLDDNYASFIKSSLENGGFYISRYELGIEDENIVSKPNKKLLQGLSKSNLENQIKNIYKTEEFNCELINGYAYDSTIEWLNQNTNIEVFNYDTDKEILTGRNSIKNIFDIFDNVFEFTR